MEEIIDELHRLAEEVPVPLELPEHDQVVEAQEQILMPLPRDFREFLMTCGDVVLGYLEPVTVADPSSHTYLPEVTSQAWEEGLPREMICVCQDGSNYYCLDEMGVVRYWESGDFSSSEWPSIWHWVDEVWMASL